MSKKKSAFTLVETIIAIVIFGIGILAVLMGLSQTLRNKDYANIQIKSAFFAREGIELMFNLRDANYHKELHWNCIFKHNSGPIKIVLDSNGNEIENSACDGYFEPGSVLKLSIGSGDDYIHTEVSELKNDFDEDFKNFQIYFHTGNVGGNTGFIYNYEGNEDEKTRFARYLLIGSVTGVNKDDKLLKIESHVLYKKGYLTGEKVMETFIGNYEF